MSLTYETAIGPEIAPFIDDLARLRITVFRDWPYLYDGDMAYERRYLARYATGNTIAVLARDGNDIVGASTGMPLSDHADDFREAFSGTGINLNDAFYCAESILLSDFRGQGSGHLFFDRREAHAREQGFTLSTFCSVIRPQGKAVDKSVDKLARDLQPFWRRLGYRPMEGVVARFRWRDIGDTGETEKSLQFWSKTL